MSDFTCEPANQCPFSDVVVRGVSIPIVMFLTTSDIMRPDQDSCFSLARCRAAYHAFNDPVPICRLCRVPSLHETPRWSAGPRRKAKMNACSTEVRKNRLKNNTTRLSPAQIKRFAIIGTTQIGGYPAAAI